MQHVLAPIFTRRCGFLCTSIWILLLPHTGHLQCAKHGVGVKTSTPTLHYGTAIASVLMGKQRFREVQVTGSARMRLTAARGVPERSFNPDSCQPPLLPCSAMQNLGDQDHLLLPGWDPSATPTHSRGEWQTPTGQTCSLRLLCSLPYILARE